MGAADRQENRRFDSCTRGALAAAALALCCALLPPPARALTSCANPDDLCRGNPCVTGQLEVVSPCVVDFGDRALVIHGTLKIPNDGVLSLKAGSIEVRRAIVGRHVRRVESSAADITLTATRDLSVRWRVDASGRTKPGRITLVAGGNVNLLAPVRAATNGPEPTAPGGSVIVDAGGFINTVKRARIRVRGAGTPGGEVVLHGRRGVRLQNRIAAGGSSGGRLAINADSGDITLGEGIDISGASADGGSATLIAPAGQLLLLDRIDADGFERGGALTLIASGPITAFGALRAGSSVLGGQGGLVVVASDGDVALSDVVRAGGFSGGQVAVVSNSASARLSAPVVASGGHAGAGGNVAVAAGKDAVIGNQVDADGGPVGGTISVHAADLITLTAQGSLLARGDSGGAVGLDAAMVSVASGARVLVDGDTPGGTITLAANDGDLILDGDFRARGRTGGRIEGTASGAVVAGGDFAARGDGCISLSAGSVLDISGGTFDVPLSDSCP
jgi:hypothetical protein